MRSNLDVSGETLLHVDRKHLIGIDALNEFLKLNEGVDLRDKDSVKEKGLGTVAI